MTGLPVMGLGLSRFWMYKRGYCSYLRIMLVEKPRFLIPKLSSVSFP
jgi:hypothetical protein